MNGSRIILAFLICGTILASYYIPEKYAVVQTYTLKGNLEPSSEIPKVLEAKIGQLLTGSVQCGLPDQTAVTRCEVLSFSRTEARNFFRLMQEKVPRDLGFTSPNQLLDRVDELQKNRTELESKLETLEASAKPLEAELESKKMEAEQMANDLMNRKKQLEILDEALKRSMQPERMEIFSQKKKEVLDAIGQIEGKLKETQNEIQAKSGSLQEIQTLKGSDEKLGQRIERIHAVLDSSGTSRSVSDPDQFQVEPSLIDSGISPTRGFSQLPWSIVIGALLFALLNMKNADPLSLAAFRNPEEIARETGLAYLGTL